MTHNPRLIRLVASHYRELQGIVTISEAMFPVMLASGVLFSSNETFILWYGVACLACFAAFMIWLRPRILAYYSSRFGRTSRRIVFPFPMLMIQGLTMGSILTDMHVPLVARYLAILLLLGGWPAVIVTRDWPHRSYWLIPLAVGVGAAFPLASRPLNDLTMAVCWAGMGIAVAVAGGLDHALLVRVLKRAPAEAEIAEPS
jgi:hypothetical protein